jgi:U3 small nucleolar RNA-associated protein 11
MSGASTMRNAVKRVTHKERAQPSNRKKFGLLEKHKDYVERANDYKKKQSHLTKLRRKALDRNPDEFYFKMNTSQVRNGVHRSTVNPNATLDNSVISTLKTQDLGYITVKKSSDDSKIRRLKESLHLIGEQRSKSHKVFVDSQGEQEAFDPAAHFNTAPELVDRFYNRPKLLSAREDSGSGAVATSAGLIDPRCVTTSLGAAAGSKKRKAGTAAVPAGYRELRERVKRSTSLKTAIDKLSLQRQLSNSRGSKRKLVVGADGSVVSASAEGASSGSKDKDSGKVVYKWKKQRAR